MQVTGPTAGPPDGWMPRALFWLDLDAAPAGTRFNAIGDEGAPLHDIAEGIGRHLSLPVTTVSPRRQTAIRPGRAFSHRSMSRVSSTLTYQQFGWDPARPGLIPCLDEGHYFNDL
jgi:hypothetical protein